MNTGENSGAWGDITNTNLGTAIEEAICESADVSFSQDSLTLPFNNDNASQSFRHLRLNLTGTGSAGITLTVPDIEKNYIINNTLATDVGIKNSSGAQVTVPNGRSAIVYSTGSGVVDAITGLNTAEVTDLTVTTKLSANGTLDVSGNGSVGGAFVVTSSATIGNTITGSSTVSDQDGDLRDIPKSGSTKAGAYTLAVGDVGNHVLYNSSAANFTIPATTFAQGDIISIVSLDAKTATVSSAITNGMFVAGSISATATAAIGANGIASVFFVSAGHVILTGNVS